MIVLAFLAIGFLLADPVFGLQVIGAFDLLQYWLWFIAIFASCIGILLVFAGGFLGNYLTERMIVYKTLAMAAGSLFGIVLAAFIAGVAYFNLWLSYYIVEHTPVNATSWSVLPDNTKYAIITFGVMWVIGLFNASRMKTNQNKD